MRLLLSNSFIIVLFISRSDLGRRAEEEGEVLLVLVCGIKNSDSVSGCV